MGRRAGRITLPWLLATVAYAAAFFPLHERLGMQATALAAVPVLVAAVSAGSVAGLSAALVAHPLNLLLLSLAGASELDAMLRGSGVLLHVSLLPLGAGVGWLSGLWRQARAQVRELERQRVLLNQQIEQQQRMEDVLEQHANAMREQARLLDLATDAIVVRRLEDGVITYWSHGAEVLYGWTKGEAQGEVLHALLQSQLDRPLRDIDADILAGARYEAELAQVTRDGRRIVVDTRWALQLDDRGQAVGMLEVSTDATRRKQLESELASARDEALEASRLKSDFLATMSHEIRTPMNGVIGMAGLLLDTELATEQRQYVEAVRRSGEALLSIIDDILDFSKIEAGKLELEAVDLDVRDVAEDVVELLAERAREKGLELACLVHQTVPRALVGDAGRLRQVLLNLVGNAIKFTPSGEVLVRVKLAEETDAQARVSFEVVDTGVGVPRDARERLFLRFSQAGGGSTTRHGGSGLGLAISKSLVDLMGGDIGFQSDLGKGSTFWFSVPFPKQPTEERGSEVASRADLHGARVLVVDDNATNRMILEQQLAQWDVACDAAATPGEGLEMLRAAATAGKPYEVAILDLLMPEMDGLALARTIKDTPATSSTGLILISSAGVGQRLREAQRAGIAAFLNKPVRRARLFTALTRVLGVALDEAPQKKDESKPRLRGAPAGRVLVVEDSAINVQVAVGMLKNLGYEVETALNGLEALEAVAHASYAAILMDCQMPEMDGFEATGEIRRREGTAAHTPIIAMTALAIKGDRERCLAAGMDDYLAKPIRIEDLKAMLERWIVSDGSEPPARAPVEPVAETTETSGQLRPFNPSTLESLRKLQEPGGSDIVDDVLDMFLREAPARLAAIEQAVEAADAEALFKAAHALAGETAMIGAEEMQVLSRQLTSIGRAGATDGACELVVELHAAFERATAMLSETGLPKAA